MANTGQRSSNEPTYSDPDVKTAMTFWVDCIREWYPDRHTKTYFYSPLQFNRVPYDKVEVAGLEVLVKQPPGKPGIKSEASTTRPVAGSVFIPISASDEPSGLVQDSDVTDDAAVERVQGCLRALSDSGLSDCRDKAMVVICGLDFARYLDKEADAVRAAACSKLPRPATMGDKNLQRGDFDVLIVHRKYGLLIGELKSVGADRSKVHDLSKAVVKRVQTAVRQLNKAREVLSHVVSDLAPLNITKTLILPYVTSDELLQALRGNPQLQKDLCACLARQDLSEAVSLCLCADQMPSVEDLRALNNQPGTAEQPPDKKLQESRSQSRVLSKLSDWWQQITLHSSGQDPNMSDSIYDHLLARFCGPATTVEIPTVTAPNKVLRTLGQAVAETGLILSTLTLYPDQVDLLNNNSLSSVHLYGPPGTGKTLVMVLKACQWLKRGLDVQVLVLGEGGRAVSFLIQEQLRVVLDSEFVPGNPQVRRHVYDILENPNDVEKAVKELEALARDGHMYIVADEVLDFFRKSKFRDLCALLKERVPSLCLWCASHETLKSPLPWLPEVALTTSLRSPPVVTREVQRSKEIERHHYILPYSLPPTPAETDGPPILWRQHRGQPGHTEGEAEDCEECGKVIAKVLKDLGVGQSGPAGLQYRDVIILCLNPRDEVKNGKAEVTQPALGIVRALRESSVPVRVLTPQNTETDLREVALAVKDEVTVSDYDTVAGLERRVVVGIEGEEKKRAAVEKIRYIVASRLDAISRCTAQLVWIGQPSD